MMSSIFSRSILSVCVTLAASVAALAQQNGMYRDQRNNYLIPLQNHDALAGHAYVMKADELSRDSSMYIVGVYDPYLVSVGERKLNIPSDFSFDCAAFDGKDIYARFSREDEAVRYIVFDQKAEIVFDTTLELRCKNAPSNEVAYYRQASIFPLDGEGIIDNVFLSGKGASSAVVRISPGRVWVNSGNLKEDASSRILYADKQRIVQAVYKYSDAGRSPVVSKTSIVTLDAESGARIGEASLGGKKDKIIYPVSAAMNNGNLEVIAEFTRETKKYARVKYGVAMYTIEAGSGKLQNSVFNEFTTTLLKDTSISGRKLMTNSYLFISHAARMSNGHWVLAMQQFSKLPVRPRLFKNPQVEYQLKNLCFVEIDETAKVLSSHLEENEINRLSVPTAFFTNPQNSGVYLSTTSIADMGYFIAPDAANDEVSFVFTDIDGAGDLVVGNLTFKQGSYKVDRFTHSDAGTYAYAGLLPARYGHTYVITYKTGTGRFELDNIKFNN